MREDGDLSDRIIGSVTIDGEEFYMYAHWYDFVLGAYRLSGDTNEYEDEPAGEKYLRWFINENGDDPFVLTLFPRNDYTIEAVNVVNFTYT